MSTTNKETKPKAKAKVKVKVETNKNKQQESKPDVPDVIMLPPFLVLLAIMAGIVLNWIFPLSFVYSFFGGIGFVLFGLSIGGIFWSSKLFKEAQTNISPKEPTTAIVTTGPYQFSRNPIYVCFIIGLVGLSFLDDSPMMLLMAVPLYFVLDLKVIQPEEKYLTEKFGDTYEDYKNSVGRWF